MQQVSLFKGSDIMDYDVQNYQDEDLAEIDDLLIDANQGSIAYALVSFGGVLGIGQEVAAVPWSALSLDRQEEIVMLDATEETLNAAVIEDDNFQRLQDQQFARQIHQQFEEEPYWEVFGFVPAAGEEATKAWEQDSEYNKKFKKDEVKEIEGTIRNVGAFSPKEGATQGMKLRVQTKEGESVTVHAGPRQYTMQQAQRENIDLTTGKEVKIKGSKTRIKDKDVIIASEITVQDKTLRLRDDEGKPQWKKEDLQQQGTQQQQQQRQQQPQQQGTQQR
ncbi:MAG: PRC-barrel domain-containing protein [Phycisphaerae bacterium]|nr:PRC-barrel domain-containing protein [Phycisphaerae bacterium]